MIKNNKELVLKELRTNGFMLCNYQNYMDDRESVLVAVKNFGIALTFASNRLKNDKHVVLSAINQNPFSLKFASDELKKDEEVVLAAISIDGHSLKYASEEFKKDKKIVLTAVKKNPQSLEYASDFLHSDLDCLILLKKHHEKYSVDMQLSVYKNWYEKVIENFDVRYEQKLMEDRIPINSEIKAKKITF